jgi:phycoerythrin-associated linker protein
MALWVADVDAIELWPNATEDNLQMVIRSVYKQVLGNAHVMESQRLVSAESLLRSGDITVRGFVRMVAQSDLYRSLFFESSSSYRFVELNCKHLLGRAPHDQAEISAHVQTYNSSGYSAEIDSYIDSAEYADSFGGFNRAFALMRGTASHSGGQSAQLISDVAGNRPTKIKALSSGGGAYTSRSKRFRITASKAAGKGNMNVRSLSVDVNYSQLSARIQSIQKSGGKILSVTETI